MNQVQLHDTEIVGEKTARSNKEGNNMLHMVLLMG